MLLGATVGDTVGCIVGGIVKLLGAAVGDIVVATGWDLAWHGTCEGEGHFALLCNGNGD
jgi:hypothetical protein